MLTKKLFEFTELTKRLRVCKGHFLFMLIFLSRN